MRSAPSIGIETGFADLDRVTNGLHAGELVVLGARPSMGKTAFASQVAINVARDGERSVLYVSRAMGETTLALRMLGSAARLDVHALRTRRLGEDQATKVARSIDLLRDARIIIDECAVGTVDAIRSVAVGVKSDDRPLALVIVDTVQDMFEDATSSSGEDDRSAVIGHLKRLARELECPVLALSNLNRRLERRADKRPLVSDLRGSGVIEEGADVVMFLYRDEVYHPDSEDCGFAELIVAKQRNGPLGSIRLKFTGPQLRFDDVVLRY